MIKRNRSGPERALGGPLNVGIGFGNLACNRARLQLERAPLMAADTALLAEHRRGPTARLRYALQVQLVGLQAFGAS